MKNTATQLSTVINRSEKPSQLRARMENIFTGKGSAGQTYALDTCMASKLLRFAQQDKELFKLAIDKSKRILVNEEEFSVFVEKKLDDYQLIDMYFKGLEPLPWALPTVVSEKEANEKFWEKCQKAIVQSEETDMSDIAAVVLQLSRGSVERLWDMRNAPQELNLCFNVGGKAIMHAAFLLYEKTSNRQIFVFLSDLILKNGIDEGLLFSWVPETEQDWFKEIIGKDARFSVAALPGQHIFNAFLSEVEDSAFLIQGNMYDAFAAHSSGDAYEARFATTVFDYIAVAPISDAQKEERVRCILRKFPDLRESYFIFTETTSDQRREVLRQNLGLKRDTTTQEGTTLRVPSSVSSGDMNDFWRTQKKREADPGKRKTLCTIAMGELNIQKIEQYFDINQWVGVEHPLVKNLCIAVQNDDSLFTAVEKTIKSENFGGLTINQVLSYLTPERLILTETLPRLRDAIIADKTMNEFKRCSKLLQLYAFGKLGKMPEAYWQKICINESFYEGTHFNAVANIQTSQDKGGVKERSKEYSRLSVNSPAYKTRRLRRGKGPMASKPASPSASEKKAEALLPLTPGEKTSNVKKVKFLLPVSEKKESNVKTVELTLPDVSDKKEAEGKSDNNAQANNLSFWEITGWLGFLVCEILFFVFAAVPAIVKVAAGALFCTCLGVRTYQYYYPATALKLSNMVPNFLSSTDVKNKAPPEKKVERGVEREVEEVPTHTYDGF